MSIVPVSEAFQRLTQEGLIKSKPQVGTRIRIPTETDIRDRFVIREALESQSARLFSERASMAERRELRDLAEDLDALYLRRDSKPSNSSLVFQVNNDHLRLHTRIAESLFTIFSGWIRLRHQVRYMQQVLRGDSSGAWSAESTIRAM